MSKPFEEELEELKQKNTELENKIAELEEYSHIVKSKGLTGAGWYRVALLDNQRGGQGLSSVVNIYRNFNSSSNEAFSILVTLVNTKAQIKILSAIKNNRFITKVRIVYDDDKNTYLELYYISANRNTVHIDINQNTRFKALDFEPTEEGTGTVLTSVDIVDT